MQQSKSSHTAKYLGSGKKERPFKKKKALRDHRRHWTDKRKFENE